MGKGARTKQYTIEMQQKIAEENRKKEKSKKIKKTVIIVLCVLIGLSGLSVGGYFGVNAYMTETGYTIHNATSLTSKNYNITDAQLAYYYSLAVSSYQSSSTDFDNSKSLKEQKYNASDEYDTWYDYFLEQAKTRVENAVCYAEGAKQDGIELTDEDKTNIDTTIKNMTSTAQGKSQTLNEYLSETYAKGVNEDDIRSCLELSTLANKYYTKYDESLEYTEKQLDDFYNKDSKEYSAIDYISYDVTAATKDESTEAETKKLMAAAKVEADKIATAKTEAEFKSLLTNYLTAYYKQTGTTKSASDISTEVSACKKNNFEYNITASAAHADIISKWGFDDARKPLETSVLEDTETDSYTVIMLLNTKHKLTYATKNVRHILLTDDSYGDAAEALTSAQNLLIEIRKASDVEKTFIADAEKYTEDTGSASDGGLYANIKKGEMTTEFDEWCYYADRKPGDTGIIRTSYGYHVMYFVSNGIPAWQVNVIDAKKTEDYKNLVNGLKEKYSVKFNADEAKKLDK